MNVDDYADSMSEMINKAIKKAFITGFQYAQSLNLTDDDFVDLGLPSGTKWSKEYLGVTELTPQGDFFSYIEAKGYSMPTEEQLKELSSNCNMITERKFPNDVTLYGPNGNSIVIKANDAICLSDQKINGIRSIYPVYGNTQRHIAFWLYNIENKPTVGFFNFNLNHYNSSVEIENAAPKYYKYQIRLVKCQNKI